MATKRGQLNCSENTKNVGYGSCVLDWKIIKGAFIYDAPRTFTDAEIADLQATLEADASKDSKTGRVFPVHNFIAPTDNSEAVVVETFDYGSKQPVRDGFNDWTFQFADGGACLSNALRTHNGKRYVLFYDKDFKIMGWKKSAGFSTIPQEYIYTSPFKLATGSNVAKYLIQFVFDPKYSNEEADVVKSPFDLSEIVGLQDVEIVVNSFDQDTGVANVTLQTICGADNIFDQYNAQLVGASFTASDEDGNTVAVSTVDPVTGNKTFNIGLNVADFPDSGIVTLKGAAISVLTGQNIIGYEIDSVDLTIAGS
jgi:hypothetical protein